MIACPFCDSGLAWNACLCFWAIEAGRHGMNAARKGHAAAGLAPPVRPTTAIDKLLAAVPPAKVRPQKPDKMSKKRPIADKMSDESGAAPAETGQIVHSDTLLPTLIGWRAGHRLTLVAAAQALGVTERTLRRLEMDEAVDKEAPRIYRLALAGLDALGLATKKEERDA